MYNDRVTTWLKRGLPLICANPDRVVEHGTQLIYCGGALADLEREVFRLFAEFDGGAGTRFAVHDAPPLRLAAPLETPDRWKS